MIPKSYMLYEVILRTIEEVQSFCRHKTFVDFRSDRALQLIVEREMEIIGEALARLRRKHPPLADHDAVKNQVQTEQNTLSRDDGRKGTRNLSASQGSRPL